MSLLLFFQGEGGDPPAPSTQRSMQARGRGRSR
jgi:hypothetical protein